MNGPERARIGVSSIVPVPPDHASDRSVGLVAANAYIQVPSLDTSIQRSSPGQFES